MSQLLIRNVEPEVAEKLKQRARRRGVSMQSELQAILRQALKWNLPGGSGTVYPPVRSVTVKGKPASRSLIEERR